MSVVGFDENVQRDIFKLMSAILLLGNVEFDDHGSDQSATVNTAEELRIVAELFGVQAGELERALTAHRMRGKGGDRKSVV